jgi:hypothetical protein
VTSPIEHDASVRTHRHDRCSNLGGGRGGREEVEDTIDGPAPGLDDRGRIDCFATGHSDGFEPAIEALGGSASVVVFRPVAITRPAPMPSATAMAALPVAPFTTTVCPA